MKYDLVIFDLDGTTLNTLADLADACNTAIGAYGYPPYGLEEFRMFIGSGIANLIRSALPEDTGDAVRAEVLSRFKAEYIAHVNDKTVPYPGIPELLSSLRSAGIKLALNTNKVDSAAQLLCSAHFPGMFEIVIGEREDIPKKPAPDGVNIIMTKLGADRSRTLYVGDSNVDLATAKNAGIDCAWVSWGFRTRDELGELEIPHAFDTAEALAAFILE